MPKTPIPFAALDEKSYTEQSNYQRLGLDENEKIDVTVVKKAYRIRTLLYHPDRNAAHKEKAEQIFKALGAAYENLSEKCQSRPTSKKHPSTPAETKSKPLDDRIYEFDDIPILPGKKSKYTKKNSYEMVLNFGDVIYYLSEKAMHYLLDRDALGWSWLPPDDFMQRVMNSGRIRFDDDERDGLILPPECIGFLKKKNNQGKTLEIIDEHYGKPTPAKIGRAPDDFIRRMENINSAFSFYIRMSHPTLFELLPHYTKTQLNNIHFAPPTHMTNEKINQHDKILKFNAVENANHNSLYAFHSPKQGQRRTRDEEKEEEQQPTKKMKI